MGDPFDGIMPKGLRSLIALEDRIRGPNLKILGATPLLDKVTVHEQKLLGASNLSNIVKAANVVGPSTASIVNAHDFYERTIGSKSILGGVIAEMNARESKLRMLAAGPMFDSLAAKSLRLNFPHESLLRASDLARPLFASHALSNMSFALSPIHGDEAIAGMTSTYADDELDVTALRREPADDLDIVRVDTPCGFCDGDLGLAQVYGNIPTLGLGLVLCVVCSTIAESDPAKFLALLADARRARVIRDVIEGKGEGDGLRVGVLRLLAVRSDEDENDSDTADD